MEAPGDRCSGWPEDCSTVGHRVDILLFRAKIHFSGEVPKEARLFVVDAIRDRLTEEYAAPELARLVRLHASTLPLQWINMARALRWDLRCLPGRRLTRWSSAVANYLETESPDCLLPNLSRAEAATFLAGRSPGSTSTDRADCSRGCQARSLMAFAPMLTAVAPTFMAFAPASVFACGTLRERLSRCLRQRDRSSGRCKRKDYDHLRSSRDAVPSEQDG